MTYVIFLTVVFLAALSAVAASLFLSNGWRRHLPESIILPVAARIRCVLRSRRSIQADRQLSDALALMCNALKAGLALPQTVELAAELLPPPLSEEFGRVLRQLRMGRDFDSAFATLAESVPTEDMELLVQSVDVLRRTGGNLIETFSSLAATIAQRRRVADKVSALTSQGVAQAVTLLMLPWLLGAALCVLAPGFIEPLYSTRLGTCLLAMALLMEAAGAVWLRKIVVIKI